MKKILFSLMVAAAFAAPAAAQKKAAPAPKPKAKPVAEQPAYKSLPIGSPIPNEGAMMPGNRGEMTSFMQVKKERGLLVMFSCNTCPYVVKAQNRTQEVMMTAEKLGIGMIIINSNEAQREGDDSPEAMMAYAIQQRYTVPYVRDDGSMMANAFGATRTPEVFLFDANGKLVYKGAMEDNPAEPAKSKELYLNTAMRTMIANRPIAVTETKSIGCSIKRRS